MMKAIYMDHAATTPLHEEVKNAMMPIFENIYGNPSSIHSFGRKARFYIDEARRVIASSIQAKENEIIFTVTDNSKKPYYCSGKITNHDIPSF